MLSRVRMYVKRERERGRDKVGVLFVLGIGIAMDIADTIMGTADIRWLPISVIHHGYWIFDIRDLD